MPLLAAQAQQGDPIALAIAAILLLILVVAVLRKRFGHPKSIAGVSDDLAKNTVPCTELAPGSAGQLKLHDVDPKTAAMLMAIVADKMGKPLNELRFISIQEVK